MNRVPTALRSRVTVLKGRSTAGKQVFVLGTAHLSKRSEEDVGELVQAIRPSDIFVELCGARSDILTRDVKHDFANFGPAEFFKAWKQSGNLLPSDMPMRCIHSDKSLSLHRVLNLELLIWLDKCIMQILLWEIATSRRQYFVFGTD